MTEEEKKVLAETADAITQKSITVEIEILHPTWWQRKRKHTKKTFVIHRSSPGTMYKISKEILDINITNLDLSRLAEIFPGLINSHIKNLVNIIAFSIVNREKDPPKSLINFLMYNLSSKEVKFLLGFVFERIDMPSFIGSIVLTKGRNILETSLTNQGS